MKNILDYLAETAQKYPDKIAFADENQTLTFRRLQERALSIAAAIPCTGQRIVVSVENDIDSILLIFAVLYSGNCYIPIDREMPMKRLFKMLSTIEPAVMLGTKETAIPEAIVPFFTLSQLKDSAAKESLPLGVTPNESDSCYMVFTSGSTGVPKAVLKSHRSLSIAIQSFCRETRICADDVIGNQSPLDYDAAAKDIYAAIYTGATCVLIPKKYFSFPKKLLEFMAERKITSVAWSAAALSLLAEMKGLDKVRIETLRRIMFSGAVLPAKHLHYWQLHYPDAEFINLYGPTEVTCTSALYRVGKITDAAYELPLGKPLGHTEIVLADSQRQRIKKAGVIGEIVIISDYAADGYFNNPALTDAVFCPNIYTNGAKLAYFTGDLGHYGQDGVLFFNGRRDHMVKHHGHRVELGEIEAVAVSLDYIGMACCLYDDQKEKIVLFYQSRQNMDKQLYIDLKEVLPKYMLPGKLIFMSQLLLTGTGKVDRQKLKKKYVNGEF